MSGSGEMADSSSRRIVRNTLMFCFRQILIMASQQFKESASCEG